METIAIYWEPVISVYGFETRQKTALIELIFSSNQLAAAGELLEQSGAAGLNFIFVLLQNASDGQTRLKIAIEAVQSPKLLQQLELLTTQGHNIAAQVKQPVDLIFFHGPHFQDRYGIAEKTFQSLSHSTVTLHASGCCGTSIYLVVGEGEATLVKELLADSFVVPGDKSE